MTILLPRFTLKEGKRLILEKGEDYDSSKGREQMERLLGYRFKDIYKLVENLPVGCYTPPRQEVNAREVNIKDFLNNSLQRIKEWPVYEIEITNFLTMDVKTNMPAKIRVIEEF